MSLPVRVEAIDEARPLLALLPDLPDDERFAFVRDGEGIVGWGVAARIPVGTGPERFTRAREGLIATCGGGPGPIAFASFAFDEDDAASVLVIPQVAIVRRDGRTSRVTVSTDDAGSTEAAPLVRRPTDGSTLDRPRYGGSTVRDDVWLDAVAQTLAAIGEGSVTKVVLARDLHLWSRNPFDVLAVLEALATRFPSCMTFLVDHLLGASPELLLRREGARIASRVLAGTAPRGADAAEDAALGVALLASTKDLHEHDLALTSVVEALAPECETLDAPGSPSLVRLDNVQHLGSDVTGALTARADTDGTDAKPPHVLDLLARLHPTAAVGGAPRAEALATIHTLEGMERGRYAGPVGWCTPDGDGEFAIALRCAEVRGDRARLFAGAGVVAGSLPETELTETWLKLRAMTGVLGA